jgi:hypothetical protein
LTNLEYLTNPTPVATQEDSPLELPDISFEEENFQNVINKLRASHGDHVTISSQSIPPTANPSPTPSVVATNDTDTTTPNLDSIFLKEAALLNDLNDCAHYEAYKSCFRIRLYHSIRQRYPSNSAPDEAIISWLGFSSPKTFRNVKSRHKRGMEALTRLRRLEESEETRFNHRVLSKILVGPLEILPPLADTYTDLDERDVLNAAFSMSGNHMDNLIREILKA